VDGAWWGLLPCAAVLTDVAGRVLDLNPEFSALTGRSRALWLGQPLDQGLPPAARMFLQTHVLPTLLRDGEARALQLQVLGPRDQALPVLANVRAGQFEGQIAHCWCLFLAEGRPRFDARPTRQRHPAEPAHHAQQDSRHFLRTLANAVPGRLVYWGADLRCQFANQAMRDAFAPDAPSLEGRHMREVLGAELFAQNQPHVQAVLAGQAQRFERRHRLADGRLQQVLVHYVPDQAGGRVRGFVAEITDVSAIQQAQDALAQQHELMRVTLRAIGDAVITTDAQGRITWLNPAATRLTGWTCELAQGLPLAQVFRTVHEHTREPAPDPVRACLQQGQTAGLGPHTLLLSRTGAEYGIEDTTAPIRDDDGQLLGVVLVFHDVSAQRRLNREMRQLARHDALTGLVNRAEFEHRLQRAFQQSVDTGASHALVHINLDRFKLVNDACGHAAGDLLLQQVATLLGQQARGRDTLARLGGDEFALLLEHCSPEQALRVGQAICARMDGFRFVHQGRSFRVGTSIGLVPVDPRWRDLGDLQQAADAACCQAKQGGGNRVQVWHESDAALSAHHQDIAWGARLQQALDHGGFELHAQCQQDLHRSAGNSGGLRAELLLRLRQPDGSLALPGAFLPAAERFHLVARIDRWVLAQAVRWLRSLPSLAPVACLSVNLSGQSVGDRAFHAWAAQLLQGAGPEVCGRLCLEITETVAVTQLADAALFIAQVHQAGASVALDDFGAGAASFVHLRALQVDAIKIDGQFVADLITDPLAEAAVRCFLDVGRLLGMQVVAENVEQPAVLERLRSLGVHRAQGYLGHRPEPLCQLLNRCAG